MPQWLQQMRENACIDFLQFDSNWTHKQVIPLKTATSLCRQQIMMSTRTLGFRQDSKSYHQSTKGTLQCFLSSFKMLPSVSLPDHQLSNTQQLADTYKMDCGPHCQAKTTISVKRIE
jgi:hypothetical protein